MLHHAPVVAQAEGHIGPRQGRAAQHLRRVRMQNVRSLSGVAQREVLRDEVDVEQATRQMLEIPRPLGGRVLGNAVAHVGDIAHKRLGIARPTQRAGDDAIQLIDKGRGAMDHTRPGEREVLPRPGRLCVIRLEAFQ